MNTQRIIVLGFALVSAVLAAIVVQHMIGGGTPQVAARAPQISMSDVMVASEVLQPGEALDANKVHWEKWPTKAVDPSFVTRNAVSSIDDAVKDTVVRAPILAGQPIATTAIVHGQAAGFMAAMLNPGMRAVSITITADSGAGGFILPNDHVDLILTLKSNENPPRVRALTILSAVRVLAIDQTPKQEKDQKTILGKTATLELSPKQAETVAKAEGMGQLSLALRPFGDGAANAPPSVVASSAQSRNARHESLPDDFDGSVEGPAKPAVTVIRYGITAKAAPNGNSSETQQNIQRWVQ